MHSGRVLHYEIISRVGAGAMGEVYLARDTHLDRRVVLKFLAPAASGDGGRRARLELEARSLAALSHPHIARVLALEMDAAAPFLVLEHVDGETFAELLSMGPLSPALVAHIGVGLAGALAHAHERGVVHRDIKPENILITEDGHVRLADFGVARLHGAAVADPGTRVYGTPEYMSPEQAAGLQVDGRSDQYALGVVLIEALTGERPDPRVGPAEALARWRTEAEARGTSPRDLARVLERCVRADPADRYPDAGALHADLARVSRRLEGARARPWLRGPVPVVAAMGLGVAVALGTWLALDRPGPPWVESASAPRTVLVLPVAFQGGQRSDPFVARAFTEALSVGLSRFERLRVLPVPSAGDSADRPGYARAVGADLVIAGRLVRRQGMNHATLRVTEEGSGRTLWQDTRSADDRRLSFLAAGMSEEIARHLRLSMSHAYDFFLFSLRGEALRASPLAVEALASLRRSDFAGADSLTKRLVGRFPRESEARVLRAYALLSQGWSTNQTPEQRRRFLDALAALRRADPSTPWASAFEGLMHHRDGRLEEAERCFAAVAVRDDLTGPARGFILSLRGQVHRDLDDPDAALSDLERALRLDPINPITRVIYADALGTAGRVEDSIERAREAVALNPEAASTHHTMARSLLRAGRWTEAIAYGELAAHRGADRTTVALLAVILRRAGRLDEAEAQYRMALTHPESDWGDYELARYLALAGDREAALRLLRASWRLGFADPEMPRVAEFASLRGDPRFVALVDAVARRRRGVAQVSTHEAP